MALREVVIDPAQPFEVVSTPSVADEEIVIDPSQPFEVVHTPGAADDEVIIDPAQSFEVLPADPGKYLTEKLATDLDYEPTREEVAQVLEWKDAQPGKSVFELLGLAKDAAVQTGTELHRVVQEVGTDLGERSTQPVGDVAGDLLSTGPESFMRGTADLGLLFNQWFDTPVGTLSEHEYLDGWAMSVGDNQGKPREWMGAGIQSRNAVPDQLAGQPAPDRTPWDAARLKRELPEVHAKAKADYPGYLKEKRVDHFLRLRRDLRDREAARLGQGNMIDRVTTGLGDALGETLAPVARHLGGLPDHEATPLPATSELGSYVADPSMLIGGVGSVSKVGKGLAGQAVGRSLEAAGKAAEVTGKAVNAVGKIPEKVVGAGVEKFTGSAARGLEAEKMIARGEMVALPAAMVSPMLAAPVAAPVAAKAAGATAAKTGRAVSALGRAVRQPSSKGVLGRIAKDKLSSPALRSLAANLEKIDPALGFAGSLARGGAIGSATGALLTLPTLDEELIAQGVGAGAVFGVGGAVIAAPLSRGMRNRQGEAADIAAFMAATRERGYATPEQIAQHLGRDDMLNLADAELILGDTDVIAVEGAEQYRAAQAASGIAGDSLGVGAAVFIPAEGGGQRNKIIIDVANPGSRGAILHEIGHALFLSADPGEVTGELVRVYGEEGIAKMKQEYAVAFLKDQAQAGRPNKLPLSKESVDAWIESRDSNDPHWLVDEVFAEQFAGAGGRRFRDLMKSLPASRVILEKLGGALKRLGINVKPDGDIPGRSSLFSALKRDPGLTRLVKTYLRQRDQYLGAIKAETRTRDKRIDPSELADHPALTWERKPGKNYEENDHFIKLPDGTVIPKERGVAKEAERYRVEQTRGLVSDAIRDPADPMLGPRRQIDGKVTIRGTRLPEGFYDLDSWGDESKAVMRTIEEAIGNGQTFSAWYQQIGTGLAWAKSVLRGKGNLKASFREFKPFAFQLSEAGNLMAHVVDVNAVWARAAAWQKAGRLGPWDGSLAAFQQDLKAYVRNHQEGRPGAHGIGEAKRDKLNAFFGTPLDEVTIKEGRGNPNAEARAVRSRNDSGLIKTFRIDRLQNVKPTNRDDFFFNYRKQQINFRPSPRNKAEADQQYQQAVDTGDLDTAQRMVDEAARAAGYTTGPVFHGTPEANKIAAHPVFDRTRSFSMVKDANRAKQLQLELNQEGESPHHPTKRYMELLGEVQANQASGVEPVPVYFTENEWVARTYANPLRAFDYGSATPSVLPFHLKMSNPMVIDGKGKDWGSRGGPRRQEEQIRQAKAEGFDGVVIHRTKDTYNRQNKSPLHEVYVTFDPTQIKSADPVTKDANGKVIPLSERFNPTRQDIRFSPRRDDGANINRERLAELGTTTDFREAGYMTPAGKLVDLSGKGEGGPAGTRSYDHREAGGTSGMQEFQAEGNIRVSPESGGLDMVKAPTTAQEAKIKRWVDNFDGEVIVDLADGLGKWDELHQYYREAGRTTSVEFPAGTSPAKVLGTVRRFYRGEDVAPGVRFSPSGKSDLPMSAVNVLYADSDELPKPRKKIKNAAVAEKLRDAAIKYWGDMVTSTNITREQFLELVQNGVAEVLAALEAEGGNAANWYTTSVKAAIEIMGVLHPEIVNDAAARATGVFKSAEDAKLGMMTAMAITSQNLSVELNSRYAEEQFAALKNTGKFDPTQVYGEKAESISGNLELANIFIDQVGWGDLRKFVDRDFTVAQLEKEASSISGRKINIAGKVDDIVQGASIFGPKIGQGFLQNLLGKFDPVTIDLWMRRTWGRWTGDVVGAGATPERLARLLDAARDYGKDLGPIKGVRAVTRNRKSGAEFRTVTDAVVDRLETDYEFGMNILKVATELNTLGQKHFRLSRLKTTPAQVRKLKSGELDYKAFIRNQETNERRFNAAYDKAKKRAKKKGTPIEVDVELLMEFYGIDRKKAEKKGPKDRYLAKWYTENGLTAAVDKPGNLKPEWSKASAVIVNALNPIDVPAPADRRVISALVNDIRKEMEKRGYKTTNADIQAILWYPEKDVWAKLKGEKESNLKSSYEQEFQKIAEARGLGEEARRATSGGRD